MVTLVPLLFAHSSRLCKFSVTAIAATTDLAFRRSPRLPLVAFHFFKHRRQVLLLAVWWTASSWEKKKSKVVVPTAFVPDVICIYEFFVLVFSLASCAVLTFSRRMWWVQLFSGFSCYVSPGAFFLISSPFIELF